jgi:hypothetical protein
VLLIFSPAGMEGFFEEAAARRIPLQAVSTDPAIQEALAEVSEKYGFAFAEFPAESSWAGRDKSAAGEGWLEAPADCSCQLSGFRP